MTDYRKRRQTTTMILHSFTREEDGDLMAYLEANGRVMGLLEIGYHVVIDAEGVIHSARPLDTVGSHTRGFNEESVGVGIEFYGVLRPAQITALRLIHSIVRNRYGPIRVAGHCELGRHRHRPEHETCPRFCMKTIRSQLGEPEVSEKLSPQQQIVLDLLRDGRKTLSNKLAAMCYGVNDLPKRVSELRAMGYEIEGEWFTEEVRGQRQRFIKYRIPTTEEPDQA